MNITLLKNLTPAEVLHLENSAGLSLPRLLKYTLADLFFKNVLDIKTEKFSRQFPSEDHEYRNYVKPGNAFHCYVARQHEEIFLAPFRPDSRLRILLRHFMRIVYLKAMTQTRFLRLVRGNGNMDHCIRVSFLQRFRGKFSLTPEGRKMQRQLEAEMELVREALLKDPSKDSETVRKLGNTIGGNLFLFTASWLPFAAGADLLFLHELLLTQHRNSPGCSAWTYTDYSGIIEAGCGGSGCGGSGCGGDSGCGSSGCSGCSGCGGGGCGGCGGGGCS